MNLSEFRAWFEGFTENISGVPTKKQWARIKERVEEITPDPTPWPIFIERYVRPYRPWWSDGTTWSSAQSSTDKQQALSPEMQMSSADAWQNAGRLEYNNL